MALNDYAAARHLGEQERDFRAYCQDPPAGRRAIPVHQVALDESDSTKNPRFAAGRCFPVPTDVEPSGTVYMWAHVKLGAKDGTTSPRMHFYDDTARPTGLIYVGYLGPHLPNTRTD